MQLSVRLTKAQELIMVPPVPCPFYPLYLSLTQLQPVWSPSYWNTLTSGPLNAPSPCLKPFPPKSTGLPPSRVTSTSSTRDLLSFQVLLLPFPSSPFLHSTSHRLTEYHVLSSLGCFSLPLRMELLRTGLLVIVVALVPRTQPGTLWRSKSICPMNE